MCVRADGLGVSEADDQAPIHELKNAATRLQVDWYLRCATVHHNRCVASGTKLKVSS
jgi:hypothetical protein